MAATKRNTGRTAAVGLAVLVAIGGIFAGATVPRAGWTSGDVTTGAHSGYPDLQPRVYDMDVPNTTQFAAAALSRLPRVRVIGTDTARGTVTAEAGEFPLPRTDDVTVTVTPQGEKARVTIRSHTRGGGPDFGENARHIREIQAAMDKQLPPG